jgi:cytochrome c oxidase cbb3-type subunit 3
MRTAALLFVCAMLCGCHRETREAKDPPIPFSQAELATTSTVMAGGGGPPRPDPRILRFEKNAYHIGEGHRLYEQFNCADCHGVGGGGGIGVPLIDEEWIYGSSSPQIVATLIQGRPNGMPSFRNKLTETQMWQVAAWVRTMAAQTPKDAAPSRSDDLATTPPVTLEGKPLLKNSNTDAGSR